MDKKTMLKEWVQRLKKPGTAAWLIVGLAGLLLIGLSGLTETTRENRETDTASVPYEDAEHYRETLCGEVRQLCDSLTGNRTVTVNITLDTGVRSVYASETSENKNDRSEEGKTTVSTDSKTTYITVRKASGGEEALLVTRYMPTVRGVAVVLSGQPDEALITQVKEAVAAALGITARKVYVGQTNGS